MGIEMVCLCKSLKERHRMFDLFLECYPERIRKVNKVGYSFILDDIKVKFVTPYNERTYLKGRRDVVLFEPGHVRPFLEKEIERRKQNAEN